MFFIYNNWKPGMWLNGRAQASYVLGHRLGLTIQKLKRIQINNRVRQQ